MRDLYIKYHIIVQYSKTQPFFFLELIELRILEFVISNLNKERFINISYYNTTQEVATVTLARWSLCTSQTNNMHTHINMCISDMTHIYVYIKHTSILVKLMQTDYIIYHICNQRNIEEDNIIV